MTDEGIFGHRQVEAYELIVSVHVVRPHDADLDRTPRTASA